jgi:hypothetical protein
VEKGERAMTRRQANNLEKKIERGMKESFKKLVLRTRERNGELVLMVGGKIRRVNAKKIKV